MKYLRLQFRCKPLTRCREIPRTFSRNDARLAKKSPRTGFLRARFALHTLQIIHSSFPGLTAGNRRCSPYLEYSKGSRSPYRSLESKLALRFFRQCRARKIMRNSYARAETPAWKCVRRELKAALCQIVRRGFPVHSAPNACADRE